MLFRSVQLSNALQAKAFLDAASQRPDLALKVLALSIGLDGEVGEVEFQKKRPNCDEADPEWMDLADDILAETARLIGVVFKCPSVRQLEVRLVGVGQSDTCSIAIRALPRLTTFIYDTSGAVACSAVLTPTAIASILYHALGNCDSILAGWTKRILYSRPSPQLVSHTSTGWDTDPTKQNIYFSSTHLCRCFIQSSCISRIP